MQLAFAIRKSHTDLSSFHEFYLQFLTLHEFINRLALKIDKKSIHRANLWVYKSLFLLRGINPHVGDHS